MAIKDNLAYVLLDKLLVIQFFFYMIRSFVCKCDIKYVLWCKIGLGVLNSKCKYTNRIFCIHNNLCNNKILKTIANAILLQLLSVDKYMNVYIHVHVYICKYTTEHYLVKICLLNEVCNFQWLDVFRKL